MCKKLQQQKYGSVLPTFKENRNCDVLIII